MNKTEIEKDFHRRYGNGSVHTCFVPLIIPIMGTNCYKYGGTTLVCAINAGVWLCGGIRNDNQIVVSTTSDNTRISIPIYNSPSNTYSPSYLFLTKLMQKFNTENGVNLLFHCDIPHTLPINYEVSYLTAIALIINRMFSDKSIELNTLVSEFTDIDYNILYSVTTGIRKNHIICINGKDSTVENLPISTEHLKIICAYSAASYKKNIPILKNGTPLPLNDLKLDAIEDKNSQLYYMTLSSHNALAASKTLKNNNTDSFFNTFSEKCNIDGCIAHFKSCTDIYFSYNNHIDHIINQVNHNSDKKMSFIISDCSGGAILY